MVIEPAQRLESVAWPSKSRYSVVYSVVRRGSVLILKGRLCRERYCQAPTEPCRAVQAAALGLFHQSSSAQAGKQAAFGVPDP